MNIIRSSRSLLTQAIIALALLLILIVIVASWVLFVNNKLITQTRVITSVDIPNSVAALEMIDTINDLFFNLYSYANGDKTARAEFYENSIEYTQYREKLNENIENAHDDIDLTTHDLETLRARLKFIDQYFAIFQEESETEIFKAFDPSATQRHSHHKDFILEEITSYIIAPLTDETNLLSKNNKNPEILRAALDIIATLENPLLNKSQARESYFKNLQIIKAHSTSLCVNNISLGCDNYTRKLNELSAMGEQHFEFEFTSSKAQTQQVLNQFVADYLQPIKTAVEAIALDASNDAEIDIDKLNVTLSQIQMTILFGALSCIIVISLLFIVFWRRIMIPIRKVSTILAALGKEDKTIEIPKPRAKNEVGLIYYNLRNLKESLIELDELKERELNQIKSDHNEALEEAYLALKASEEELRNYSVMLENTNQELEQFIHIASHDFREPLKNIAGYTQMLRAREKEPEALALVDNIAKCSNRAGILIDDLRALTKLHKIEDDPQMEEIEPVFVRAFAEHKTDFDARGAQVEIALSGHVECYEHYLRIVFDQLIANAKHYGAKHLQFSVKNVETAQYTTIEIQNNLDRKMELDQSLFLPFKRGQNASRDSSGVGLSVCRKIVEDLHGGKIWIDNSEASKKEEAVFRVFIRLPKHLSKPEEFKRSA